MARWQPAVCRCYIGSRTAITAYFSVASIRKSGSRAGRAWRWRSYPLKTPVLLETSQLTGIPARKAKMYSALLKRHGRCASIRRQVGALG